MTDKFETGQVIEGKVTGIQPYGAFVSLNDEIQGLVHISEVTHGYVKDINDHLTVGDEVKVKILNIDEEKNKVSLSIRATEEAPKKSPKAPKAQPAKQQDNSTTGFNTLKDKLEEWIEQSEDREGTFKN
ncbi:S1 domain-containing post-transcriptional regulator GSP13 [Virgibacillus ndiopensis]|uniref:S1 domain-containing post-transcriptional regulator GSP13 n=1 Tax=Virgibacillus ndiopensis TaxID=2004408 RepID=UPI000C07DD61|nr:S1 domain-containing post-transcriptional regulator GSP13 [Virgibacillus ndiopensis]